MANISYSKLLDPVSDIISLMESLLSGAFGATTGDQRECYKRIHAYCWGLHTLVMDVITSLGIENAATRPAVLERFHALNHPVKSMLDNLAAGFDGPLNEEQLPCVEYALETAFSIEHMMSNLWQFSLLKHREISYANDEFDGSLLIQRMKSVLKDTSVAVEPMKFKIIGDRTRLAYAFGEIAYNIRWHAGVDQISVSTQYFGYRADITIFDRGKGFRQDDKETPFQPYWQAGAGDAGLGLGLYLARQFIEGSGGTISISSEPGLGTLVKVSLKTLP